MKVLVIVKATADSEDGTLPTTEMLEAMGKYNEELVNAGIMLYADGLKPSNLGVRVRFSGKDRTVSKGPFKDVEELIAGFWIWQVKSMEGAIEWVMRAPNPMLKDSDIEIRPFYELEDFGDNLTPEITTHHKEMRKKLAALS